ncbi:MAG: hypothetical protein V1689_04305 [Pseudomonadota bacterium]
MTMIHILFGSVILSLIHAAIPNHWIPLVAIARTEGWSRPEALRATAITGSAHTISTILVGIMVGLIGYRLSDAYEMAMRVVGPSVLVILGIIYLILDLRGLHSHGPAKHNAISRRANLPIIASLTTAMFFSPCLEIEAYYFTAGALGWPGIVAVSVVYLIVTVIGMLLLVDLGLRGASRIKSHFLTRHEKGVTGLALVALGAVAYLVNA